MKMHADQNPNGFQFPNVGIELFRSGHPQNGSTGWQNLARPLSISGRLGLTPARPQEYDRERRDYETILHLRSFIFLTQRPRLSDRDSSAPALSFTGCGRL